MNTQTNTKPFSLSHLCLLAAAAPLLSVVLSSCSSEGVAERMEERNELMDRIGENAEIRRDARDARYDRQFDRLMD